MEMIDMGKYGAYVWSCFSLALIILVFNEWRARLRQKAVFRDIEVRLKAQEGKQ